jgi:hypothetical protein
MNLRQRPWSHRHGRFEMTTQESAMQDVRQSMSERDQVNLLPICSLASSSLCLMAFCRSSKAAHGGAMMVVAAWWGPSAPFAGGGRVRDHGGQRRAQGHPLTGLLLWEVWGIAAAAGKISLKSSARGVWLQHPRRECVVAGSRSLAVGVRGGRIAAVAAEQGSAWRDGKHACGVASVRSDARMKLKKLPVVE